MRELHVKGLEALGLDMDDARAVRLGGAENAQMYCGGERSTVLMIRVVAGKLSPSGHKYLFLHSVNLHVLIIQAKFLHISGYTKNAAKSTVKRFIRR